MMDTSHIWMVSTVGKMKTISQIFMSDTAAYLDDFAGIKMKTISGNIHERHRCIFEWFCRNKNGNYFRKYLWWIFVGFVSEQKLKIYKNSMMSSTGTGTAILWYIYWEYIVRKICFLEKEKGVLWWILQASGMDEFMT